MIINSEDLEDESILIVAKLMVTAARTAPKARGEDKIKAAIVIGDEKDKLANMMEKIGRVRDSKNVKQSGVVVLLGVDYLTLGGSAASKVGQAAKKMGLMKADEIQGIPLSIKGKNIFFDRKS